MDFLPYLWKEKAMTTTSPGNIEKLSRKFHEIYQTEAKRQADLGIDKVRHPDNYDVLPERTKEYDRVLARYIIEAIPEEKDYLCLTCTGCSKCEAVKAFNDCIEEFKKRLEML